MGRYLLSEEAKADILDILDYISEDNPDAAEELKNEFFDCFEVLAKWKETGRQRPELDGDLRSFPIRRYIVFYITNERSITVVRVIHGARDLDEMFSE